MGRDNKEIHGGLGAPPVDCTQKKGELGGSTVNGDYVICSDMIAILQNQTNKLRCGIKMISLFIIIIFFYFNV